jgi:hypothetical protein
MSDNTTPAPTKYGDYLDGYAKDTCGRCGLERTVDGHDGCIGFLPGVANACCGHGEEDCAYVQFFHQDYANNPNKLRLSGIQALDYFRNNSPTFTRVSKQIKMTDNDAMEAQQYEVAAALRDIERKLDPPNPSVDDLGVPGAEPPVGLSAVFPRGGEDAASIPHAEKGEERHDEPSANASMADAVVNRPESESAELKGYRVEARTFAPGIIKDVLGTMYGHDWKEVPMQPQANGIPGDMWSIRLSLAHCHSYAQAIALAWTLKAMASSLGVYSLQVRIVRYNVRLSWRSEPDGFASRLPNDDRTDKSFTPVEIVEP